jgi:peptide/nickel transport system ATP-binding protein
MSAANAPILTVQALKKYFSVKRGVLQRSGEPVRAVDGVDLQIMPRETLGLVGESGSGKSTVARLILKLLEADGGTIRFDGRDITRLPENRFKPLRKEMQMIFQDPYSSLNPRMTVAQSIGEGVRIAGIKSRSDQQHRIEALLDMVGMPRASADRYPHEFSGGQRQRIGIARALSVAPQLIICDEPISALDVSIQAQIINLLKDLQTELGLSYLFISHDLNVVSYICDHVCVMYRGRILESAPAEMLFEAPCHPYTRKLLSAVPDSRKRDWKPVDEVVGTSVDMPSPCQFAGQCPERTGSCDTQAPDWVEIGPSHWVRCRHTP